jgi:hypothetical protein
MMGVTVTAHCLRCEWTAGPSVPATLRRRLGDRDAMVYLRITCRSS